MFFSYVWSFFLNSWKNLSVKMLINRLALKHEAFFNDFQAVKKTNL